MSATKIKTTIRGLRFALAFIGASASAADKLDLPAAIELALHRNADLARSAKQIESSQASLGSARSDFALRLRPDANAAAADGDVAWQYGLQLGRQTTWGTDVGVGARYAKAETGDDADTERATASLQLQQPLFRNFGPLPTLEPLTRAGSSLNQVRRRYELQRADLILEIVQVYETIVQVERQIEFDRDYRDRMDRLLRLTRARQQQGRAGRVDTLRVELEQGQAALRLADSEDRLANARRQLAELIGAPLDQAFELEPPPLLDIEPQPIEALVAIAFSNRMDYAQVLQDYDDAVRGVRLADRQRYPDMDLVTRYERYGQGADLSSSGSGSDAAWFVGLVAASDYNPARIGADRSVARADRDAVRESIRIVELSIAQEVRQTWADCQRARGDLKIAERNARLAEARATLARRLFQFGRGDNFSVTDAEQAFNDAENQRLKSRAEASIVAFRLRRILGTLTETPPDLKPRHQDLRS